MRLLRLLMLLFGAVVVLALAGIVVLALTLDPNVYKPQIIEAVRRQTGRELMLNGPLHLKLALRPTIIVTDVSLANAPGGSRPQMATIGRVEAQFGLLPLLRDRVEIDRLLLVKPDILLETDSGGRPNWIFHKPASSPTDAPPPSSRTARHVPPPDFAIRVLRIEDGALTLHDGRTGQTIALAVATFRADAPSDAAPLNYDLHASIRQTPFTLAGSTGPIDTIIQNSNAPWPVTLTAAALGAQARIEGTIGNPQSPSAYALKVQASVPQLASLAPLLPGISLPAVNDLHVSAQLDDSGSALARITELRATAAQSDLSAYAPGLLLSRAEIDVPALDKPAHVDIAGTYAGVPFSAKADSGAPAGLLPGGNPESPFPVALVADVAGAHLSANGGIAHPATMSGMDIAISASIPDLAALAPLVRQRLPALHDITAQGRIADAGSGLAQGVSLKGAHLKLPEADLTGDLIFTRTPRPSLRGTISASTLNFDALQAAWEQRAEIPAPATQAAPAAPAPGRPTPAPQPAAGNRPLPLDKLRQQDADIQFSAASLQRGGETWRNVRGHLVLANGKLTLDPFDADLPAGHLDLKTTVDANQARPPITLMVRSPGLEAAPFVRGVTGRLEIDADLRGTGETPHAFVATASGRLGLAITSGTADTSVLESAVGPILRAIRLPDLAAKTSRTKLRCAAVSMTLANGIGTVKALGLDTDLFTMSGNGTVNFANDTLDLRVHPTAAVAGDLGVSLTLNVTGPIEAPQVVTNVPGSAVDAGRTAGLALTGPVGLAIGALGLDRKILGDSTPTCVQALAAVRGTAAPAAPQAAAQSPARAKPGDLLRRLFR